MYHFQRRRPMISTTVNNAPALGTQTGRTRIDVVLNRMSWRSGSIVTCFRQFLMNFCTRIRNYFEFQSELIKYLVKIYNIRTFFYNSHQTNSAFVMTILWKSSPLLFFYDDKWENCRGRNPILCFKVFQKHFDGRMFHL